MAQLGAKQLQVLLIRQTETTDRQWCFEFEKTFAVLLHSQEDSLV